MKSATVTKTLSSFVVILGSFYAAFIWSWSYNFPNADDYTAILLPLIKYSFNPSFENFLATAFEPHTQHLQVLLRFVAFATWKGLGVLNFRVLIAIGLLSIPVLIWMIGKLAGPKHQTIALILALLAIAQPQYAEATLWATNAIPYLWVNVFAAAAIYSRIKLNSWWSLLWATLSCLSWGNGILVPFICFISPKKCSRLLRLSHLILFMVFALLHLKNPNTSGISRGSSDILNILLYFLSLVGSAPGYYSSSRSLFFGSLAVITALYIFLRYRNYQIYNHPLFLFSVFLAGSLFLCAITRVSEGAFSAYTTSRYTLPSILLILALVLLALELAADKKLYKFSAITFGLLFWFYSMNNNSGFMRQRYELLADSEARWGLFSSGLAGTSWETLNSIHEQAESAHIISVTASSKTLEQRIEVPISKSKAEAIVQIEYLLTSSNALHLSGYFVPIDNGMRGHRAYLLLKGLDGARYVFAVQQRDRPDVVLHLSQVQPDLTGINERNSGFSVFANISDIPADTYSAYLIVTTESGSPASNSDSIRFDLKRTIEIKR